MKEENKGRIWVKRMKGDGVVRANWENRTVWTGDNLYVMRGMNSETVDLIYLDPPFNSNVNYAAPVDSQAAGAAFKDIWVLSDVDIVEAGRLRRQHGEGLYKIIEAAEHTHSKGMRSYLTMMASRLVEMKRILKSTGSIYLHCDPAASHYLKAVMDGVFGRQNFLNEIIWSYGLGGSSKRFFSRKHDILLFYGKTGDYHFSKPLQPATSRKMTGQMKGMTDCWNDIPSLSSMAKERIQYPTQKPLALLERIIQASSNEGDMVFDPFCGCGTTLVAADRLQRQWVGIDIFPGSAELMQKRIEKARGVGSDIIHSSVMPQRSDVEMGVLAGCEGANRLGVANRVARSG